METTHRARKANGAEAAPAFSFGLLSSAILLTVIPVLVGALDFKTERQVLISSLFFLAMFLVLSWLSLTYANTQKKDLEASQTWTFAFVLGLVLLVSGLDISTMMADIFDPDKLQIARVSMVILFSFLSSLIAINFSEIDRNDRVGGLIQDKVLVVHRIALFLVIVSFFFMMGRWSDTSFLVDVLPEYVAKYLFWLRVGVLMIGALIVLINALPGAVGFWTDEHKRTQQFFRRGAGDIRSIEAGVEGILRAPVVFVVSVVFFGFCFLIGFWYVISFIFWLIISLSISVFDLLQQIGVAGLAISFCLILAILMSQTARDLFSVVDQALAGTPNDWWLVRFAAINIGLIGFMLLICRLVAGGGPLSPIQGVAWVLSHVLGAVWLCVLSLHALAYVGFDTFVQFGWKPGLFSLSMGLALAVVWMFVRKERDREASS